MYLLDTNVVSELRKLERGRTHSSFASWFETAPLNMLYISAITLFELEYGIELLRRHDPDQAAILRHWLDKVTQSVQDRILPIDREVAVSCAILFVPNPPPWRDALIGATALTHHFSLVTRNTRDFQGMGIELLNPWDG